MEGTMRKALLSIGFALLACLIDALGESADKWEAELKTVKGKISLVPKSGLQETGTVVGRAGSQLYVDLASGLKCNRLAANLENEGAANQPIQAKAASGKCLLEVPSPIMPTATLKISYDGRGVSPEFPLKKPPAEKQPDNDVTKSEVSLKDLLNCTVDSFQLPPYDRRGNLAYFAITPLGTVLSAPNESIDENDTVRIVVFVHPGLMPFLKVKRTSAIRTVGGLNIIGAEVTVPLTDLKRQAAGVKPCSRLDVELRDFAPGAGTVTVSAQIGEKDVTLGTVEFLVNRLYHGMFSLGAISTKAVERDFTVVATTSGSVIADENEGDRDVIYGVFYTPFVWGRRDLEKSDWGGKRLREHFNPSFGVATSDLSDNALAGISFDAAGFVFTAGRHWRHGKVLSSSSGLRVGSPFSGTESEIPTARKWDSSSFVSVSIDLRAAVALLKSAFGGSGKQ
jgi:hypothetical protein